MSDVDDIDLTLLQEADVSEGELDPSRFVLHEDRYTIQDVLGQGAMGEILAARDKNLRRSVAYKQLLKPVAGDVEVMKRFIKEAQITAQLAHPNIIPIYDLQEDGDGHVAYAMKLIQGETLKARIQAARVAYDAGESPDDECALNALLHIFLKVCDAMHYAHTHGVIHRDLKPANIMIGPYQEVYVMDWGIARLIASPERERPEHWVQLPEPEPEESGLVIGTPRYLSPQQAAGRNAQLDSRSDQFTLGLILYEIVALRSAFQAETQIDLLKQILKAEKRPLSPYRKAYRIPLELVAIIEKATARQVHDRYANTQAMADDVRRFLRGEAVLARPDTPRQALLRWMGKHRQLTFVAIGVLCLCGVLMMGGSLYRRQQAMLASQRHERQLQALMHDLTAHAQHLDQRAKAIERVVLSLTAVVVDALTQPGDVRPFPVYLSEAYRTLPAWPTDLQKVVHYQEPVSLQQLVFKPAGRLPAEALQTEMRQLAPLRDVFREQFFRSIEPVGLLPAPATQIHRIAQGHSPLSWLNVSLEKGLIVTYPGTPYPEDFDPRPRPWYQEARHQKDLFWGSPYADIQGEGLMMPCVQAIFDYQNQRLGVTSTDLRLHQVALQWLPLPDPRIERLFLLNETGGIIAEIHQGKPVKRPVRLQDHKLWLEPYSQSQVVENMRHQFTGYVETNDTLYTFSRVSSWNWTLVSESPVERVFQ